MNAAILLTEVTRAGVRLSVRGDRLHVEARAGIITPAMRQGLAEAKPELIAMLTPHGARLQTVQFRLKTDPPGIWHTALGPDADDLAADLLDRYRNRLCGIRKPDDDRDQ